MSRIQGLALSVDPSFKLVKGAYPFIAKQILSNQNPGIANGGGDDERMASSAGLGSASADELQAQTEMNRLLTSVMINRTTGRIRWDKLEQFVFISDNADQALAGDFKALQVSTLDDRAASLYHHY